MSNQINPSIFKAYDIRGIYPQDLNEGNIEVITKAIYATLAKGLKKQTLKVILGRDMRISSPSLHEIVRQTLLSIGAQVFDAGMISTPTMYFSVLNYQADIGIQITASHNPAKYNGLKIVRRDGKKIIKIGKGSGMEKIRELSLKNQFSFYQKKGALKEILDATAQDVNQAIKSVGIGKIKKLKIVVDPANGMGISYLEEIFKKIPCQLIKMNFNYDGTFPAHEANPLKFETLKQLQKKVIEEKADLGIAPDGDGDRVFFVDEQGKIIPATLITSLIADQILKKNPKSSIVVDIRYIGNVVNVCKKYGAKYYISPVGHAFITPLLNEKGAEFAGESSGHFFFKETGGAESSVRVILMILKAITDRNQPISEIVKSYLSSFESGEYNFVLPQKLSANDLFNMIEKNYSKGKISHLDGLAVEFPQWRFSLRASNTEPLVRLNVESDNERLTQEKLKELMSLIIKTGAKRE